MRGHLRMLLKAIHIVVTGLLIIALVILLLIAYMRHADESYKEQWGWKPHVAHDLGMH